MTTRAHACSLGERENERWHCTDFFSEKNGWLSLRCPCGASSLSTKELERANGNVSRVLCPGDGESAKLTPRAHYNDYTAKERAEIGKHAAEGSRARGNTIRNSPKFKIAKLYTYPILTVSPNLMAAKISRYTVAHFSLKIVLANIKFTATFLKIISKSLKLTPTKSAIFQNC